MITLFLELGDNGEMGKRKGKGKFEGKGKKRKEKFADRKRRKILIHYDLRHCYNQLFLMLLKHTVGSFKLRFIIKKEY